MSQTLKGLARKTAQVASGSHKKTRQGISVAARDLVDTATHTGWLLKCGTNFRSWRKRFFVLNGSVLFWFEEPTSATAFGALTLNSETRLVRDEKAASFFSINVPGVRVLNMQVLPSMAADLVTSVIDVWASHLRAIIDDAPSSLEARPPVPPSEYASVQAAPQPAASAGYLPVRLVRESVDRASPGDNEERTGNDDLDTGRMHYDSASHLIESIPEETTTIADPIADLVASSETRTCTALDDRAFPCRSATESAVAIVSSTPDQAAASISDVIRRALVALEKSKASVSEAKGLLLQGSLVPLALFRATEGSLQKTAGTLRRFNDPEAAEVLTRVSTLLAEVLLMFETNCVLMFRFAVASGKASQISGAIETLKRKSPTSDRLADIRSLSDVIGGIAGLTQDLERALNASDASSTSKAQAIVQDLSAELLLLLPESSELAGEDALTVLCINAINLLSVCSDEYTEELGLAAAFSSDGVETFDSWKAAVRALEPLVSAAEALY